MAIDATCPLVIKVHLEAIRYAQEGYTIILIGHEGHDEVIGTMGEAPDQMILVETAEDVERLEVPDPDRVAYLTQTTLSVDDANIVIAALRKKFPADRQSPQGRHLLRDAEPPGGRPRAGRAGRPGARAGQPEQLEQPAAGRDRQFARDSALAPDRRRLRDPRRLVRGVDTVLITAGASAPEQVVQECIEYLERNFDATIQEETVREESVHFPLPRSLRELLHSGSVATLDAVEAGQVEGMCSLEQVEAE